jgi:hypothetical protein
MTAQKTLTPALLRAYHIIILGEDIQKGEITHRVRPSRADEAENSEGARTALDIIVKGEVVETHFYDASAETAVEEFIDVLREDIPNVLKESKEYTKLLAEAASAAGLLPN